jgi:hypothetical protein
MRHNPDRIRDKSLPHLNAHWNATPAERMRERAEIEHYNALSMSMMDAGLARYFAKRDAEIERIEASHNASREDV